MYNVKSFCDTNGKIYKTNFYSCQKLLKKIVSVLLKQIFSSLINFDILIVFCYICCVEKRKPLSLTKAMVSSGDRLILIPNCHGCMVGIFEKKKNGNLMYGKRSIYLFCNQLVRKF